MCKREIKRKYFGGDFCGEWKSERLEVWLRRECAHEVHKENAEEERERENKVRKNKVRENKVRSSPKRELRPTLLLARPLFWNRR